MTCKRIDLGGGMESWSCSRPTSVAVVPCEVCRSKEHSLTCEFPLRGKLAGKFCGLLLCPGCSVAGAGGKVLCPPHARMTR